MRLYRTVSRPEYDDLRVRGAFRPFGAADGKYFWETYQAAETFGRRTVGHYHPAGYRIVGAEVPDLVVASFHRWPMLDGIGPARFASADQLRRCAVFFPTEP